MKRVVDKLSWAAVGSLWMMTSGAPALADDTEVFRYTTPTGARANILFVIDDSVSMRGTVRSQSVYDPATTYPTLAGCSATRVYWAQDSGRPPQCNDDHWFNLSALACNKAITQFALIGKLNEDDIAQYDPTGNSNRGRWRDLSTSEKSRTVECQDDNGVHGDGGAAKYAIDGSNPNKWGTSSASVINWGSRGDATLYSANYVNWFYGPAADHTRLEIVQGVVDDLLEGLEGVNVGLMHFNPPAGGDLGSQGGRVAVAVGDIDTNRAAMRTAVAALDPEAYTPLAETLYEARQYMTGGPVVFGSSSVASAKVAGNPSQYKTPVTDACQENFVVFLTDGEPTYDNAADSAIVGMRDAANQSYSTLTGRATCDVETWAGVDFAAPPGGFMSHCFDDVAHFLYQGDASGSLPDKQRVKTVTVGFNVDLPVLEAAAERGNGRAAGDSDGVYFVANDAAELAGVFTEILGDIQEVNTSFTSPTVAVNAFNRAENLSDLFVSVFKPSNDYHWPGNLKKYRLRDDGKIVDATNTPAVDPDSGFFLGGTRSYWSASADGASVESGGAASIIPAARNVYSNLNGNDLNSANNLVVEGNNTYVTDTLLEVAGTGRTRADVIKFINGVNPATNQRRFQMGDPLHSQPASVIYGPGLRDGLLFVATNDGYLHALNAETGVEEWAFIPNEFMGHQVDLLENDLYAGKHYGIDGPMRIQVVADNDGLIEPGDGEKVYLFFGMRRGGDFYYGLDVTVRNDPQLLWRRSWAGAGESWSPPVPTRVKLNGTEYQALVVGGGYEADQDNDASTLDTTGNSIYIVNSATGNLLWRGSKTGGDKNFATAGRAMDYSFPGEIKVIDLNGDRIMDRMYAADMGGQVWRFDVDNTATTAANLVNGGVIAQLGTAGDGTPTVPENRRFYYSPDVAFINTRLENFVHIGIGSGHREHPLGIVNSDRFYALRDKNVAQLTQAQFNALTIMTEGSLAPVTTTNTTIATNQNGWRLDLQAGEKVLADARTIANTVFFTTFKPGATAGTCQPQPGFNRLYQMSVYNGAPVRNLDGGLATDPLSMADLFVENEGTISSTSQVIFVSRDRDNDGVPDDQDTDDDNDGVADGADTDADNDGIPDTSDPDIDGDGILNEDEQIGDQGWVCTDRVCVPLGFTNSPVRTYWRQTSLD